MLSESVTISSPSDFFYLQYFSFVVRISDAVTQYLTTERLYESLKSEQYGS